MGRGAVEFASLDDICDVLTCQALEHPASNPQESEPVTDLVITLRVFGVDVKSFAEITLLYRLGYLVEHPLHLQLRNIMGQ